MANKKKPAPKKRSRPKKAAKPAAKSASHKAVKPAAKKPAPKKAAPKKPSKPVVAKKPAPKPAAKPAAPVKKPEPAKPAAKVAVVAKPEPKPVAAVVEEAPKPVKKSELMTLNLWFQLSQWQNRLLRKNHQRPAKIVIPKTTTKSAVKYEPDFTKSVLDTPMYEQNGPSMRYSDTDLTEFREIIKKKLDAAKKELAYLQGLITRRDEGGDMDEARYMTMEDGSVSMEREQLSQMASRQITFIDHLEKAMMRIENKTYGICRVTGKLIDKARLRAVPHATLSIEAKQMMNK